MSAYAQTLQFVRLGDRFGSRTQGRGLVQCLVGPVGVAVLLELVEGTAHVVFVPDQGAIEEFVAERLDPAFHYGVHAQHPNAGTYDADSGAAKDLAEQSGELGIGRGYGSAGITSYVNCRKLFGRATYLIIFDRRWAELVYLCRRHAWYGSIDQVLETVWPGSTCRAILRDMSDDREREDNSARRGSAYRPPDLSRLYPAVNPLADYYSNWAAGIGKIISAAAAPKFTFSGFDAVMPQYPTLFESPRMRYFTEFNSFNTVIQSALGTYNQQHLTRWQDLFESLAKLRRSQYPDNWTEDINPTIDELESILIDEGIPLMWVPGPKIVLALLDAPDPSSRRQIIAQRWKGVVADCEATLGSIEHPRLHQDSRFALDCVTALRGGIPSAAQALAANLLDSVLRCYFKEDARIKLTRNTYKKNGIKFDLEDYKFQVSMTFAPVWNAHAKYKTEDGDPIPRTFGRHPTTHAVSRKQYSRVNAVYGLMLVTSVLKFFDEHLTSGTA